MSSTSITPCGVEALWSTGVFGGLGYSWVFTCGFAWAETCMLCAGGRMTGSIGANVASIFINAALWSGGELAKGHGVEAYWERN